FADFTLCLLGMCLLVYCSKTSVWSVITEHSPAAMAHRLWDLQQLRQVTSFIDVVSGFVNGFQLFVRKFGQLFFGMRGGFFIVAGQMLQLFEKWLQLGQRITEFTAGVLG